VPATADPNRPWEVAVYQDAEGGQLTDIDILRLIAQDTFNTIGL
jgi:hypothetical protein